MQTAHFTQFMLPDGRQKQVEMDVADDLAANLAAIDAAGARLECEILTTGQVSLTIFDPESETDYDIELVTNGPEVPKAVDRLIRRFHLGAYIDARETADSEALANP